MISFVVNGLPGAGQGGQGRRATGTVGMLEFCILGALSWGTSRAGEVTAQPVGTSAWRAASARCQAAPARPWARPPAPQRAGTRPSPQRSRTRAGASAAVAARPGVPSWYQRAPGATPPAGSCSRDILLVAAGDRGVLSSEPCHGHGRRWECRLLSPLPSQDGVFTPLCPAQRAGGGERKPLIKHSPVLPRPEESKVHPQSTER